jgi:hypothetical protein
MMASNMGGMRFLADFFGNQDVNVLSYAVLDFADFLPQRYFLGVLC